MLVLAGLWSGWREPGDGAVRRTFTIVTTTPTNQIATLHDRMPVVLPDDAWPVWLDPSVSERGELLAMLRPAEWARLDIHPVPTLVNDVRKDGPELVARLPA